MATDHRTKLAAIKRLDQLIAYLRDEMGWPIAKDSFEQVDDLFYEYTADELGIDAKTAAKIQEIKRLRPLSAKQPWGIFFIKFEPKRLPIVALRRILSQVALKKRASANSAERAAWSADDLLFISNYGEGEERQISFAHFSQPQDKHDLPTLRVLGWDNRDTALHLDAVSRELTEHLSWPDDEKNMNAWREQWRAAFTLKPYETIKTSKELSIRLAELARTMRDRIKTALAIETPKGRLTQLMKAFQTALVHDLDADGFADMYAQTIAYGLLSARITDPNRKTADDISIHMNTNPFLKELMETFLKVGGRKGKAGGPGIDFDEIGVSEVVHLLDAANMEAVIRDFGDRNPQEDPVIHFYELFLKEYDAKKRMQRGVFYTPRPIVSYIVRSVDELLRSEFGLEDGLADTTTWGEMVKRHKDLKKPEGVSDDQDFVQILDPATGTGTFLVEVIDLIHKTLVAKWKREGHSEKKIDALWNEYVPKNLLTRMHGYELLMAPYAIAHLKIGLKLYETGYRFGSDERARVYLTNALEPAGDKQLSLDFLPALAHEAEAVNKIKSKGRFTAIVGNPPYLGEAGTGGEWIAGLMRGKDITSGRKTSSYFEINGNALRERNSKWINDDYVKFIRLSQWLLDSTGYGVHGYVSNHGYLDNPTFRGMRWALLNSFHAIYALDLHGNIKKKEASPDGRKDSNVFDIEQGVGIGLFIKRKNGTHMIGDAVTQHADVWGDRATKSEWLIRHKVDSTQWTNVQPGEPFYLFEPLETDEIPDYSVWLSIEAILPTNSVGVVTSRDEFVTDQNLQALTARIFSFISGGLTDDAAKRRYLSTKDKLDVHNARIILRKEKNPNGYFRLIQYRPFDQRWIFYHKVLIERPRTEAMPHMLVPDNMAIITARSNKFPVPDHFFASRTIVETKCGESSTQSATFPLYLYPEVGKVDTELFQIWPEGKSGRRPNLDLGFVELIKSATSLAFIPDGSGNLKAFGSFGPEDVFAYIYAIFYCPEYRRLFQPMLKLDFPHIPAPGSLGVYSALARLGRNLLALHLLESPKVEHFITEYLGGRAPEVEKVSWSKNTVWLDKSQTIGFKGVREEVWNFHIGGYQVCEKWLKDRKGRKLSKEDIAHYQKIVVALSETIRLMKEIDQVIEEHGGWPAAFQSKAESATINVVKFRPKTVEPTPDQRYRNCVPLIPLKAAAGAFSDPQNIQDESFEWVEVHTHHHLRPGMFVAQVVGTSMEPLISDGSWCLFRAPVEGTRQGKTVLVQLRDTTDPETGQRYTVKRYESDKTAKGDSWVHERITLKPINPAFQPIVLSDAEEGELQVIAEFIEVLNG